MWTRRTFDSSNQKKINESKNNERRQKSTTHLKREREKEVKSVVNR